ncbi:MAG: hypothetical protein AB8F65_10895 [Woeseiaceae bacterium]
MAVYKAPASEEVKEMISMFIPNGVDVSEAAAAADFEKSHAALFVNGDGNVVAACSVDLPLGAALGASLSMIPPAAAEDMVSDKALSSIALSNLYEVMNMFSSLFMDDSTAHLKLTEVIAVEDTPELTGPCELNTIVEVQAGAYGKGIAQFVSI